MATVDVGGRGRLPRQFTLEAVPMRVVLITVVAAAALSSYVYTTVTEPKLWMVALAGLLPWLPVFFVEATWKYEHYGFYALMAVFVVLQIGHLGEHTVQIIQLWLAEGDATLAHGVFGELDRELVHFAWDSVVWLGVCGLIIKLGPHNRWLWISLLAASFHEVEHLFLYYLDRFEPAFYNAGGNTGVLAKGGLVSTPFQRPYLHYLYNFVVVVPLVMAFWDETKRAYNVYVARALPSLSHQERVSASTELERLRVPAGEVIVRQGEEADRFYIVVDGEVEVIREEAAGDRIIDRMGEGHFFGEMGILSGQPRTATVRALRDTELLALDQHEFLLLVSRSKGAAADVESELHERLANLEERGLRFEHLHGAMEEAATAAGGPSDPAPPQGAPSSQ